MPKCTDNANQLDGMRERSEACRIASRKKVSDDTVVLATGMEERVQRSFDR